jgi:hypothetical protein
VLEFLQPGRHHHHGAQALMFATERGEQFGVTDRPGIEEFALDVLRARARLGQSLAETQVVFPYFWRKRSTRPAVSISFCLPVKNGWQAEQMSVWISAWVERV